MSEHQTTQAKNSGLRLTDAQVLLVKQHIPLRYTTSVHTQVRKTARSKRGTENYLNRQNNKGIFISNFYLSFFPISGSYQLRTRYNMVTHITLDD